MHSFKNREDLDEIEEQASLHNQVEELLLQNKLGKEKNLEKVKKIIEPLTDTQKNTSGGSTKTITETSVKNNKAPEKLNDKLLEIMKDGAFLAFFFVSLM